LSARAKRDAALKVEVRRVFEENFRVYGVCKVWHTSNDLKAPRYITIILLPSRAPELNPVENA